MSRSDSGAGGAPASVRISRPIEWSDTDASGYWHYLAALRMIGWAESALLESLGILEEARHSREILMPRVHVEADFRSPCRFRDRVDVTVGVEEVGTTSLTYRAEIRRAGQLCVEAKLVAVLQDGSGRPMEWPEEWRRLLSSAGPQAPQAP